MNLDWRILRFFNFWNHLFAHCDLLQRTVFYKIIFLKCRFCSFGWGFFCLGYSLLKPLKPFLFFLKWLIFSRDILFAKSKDSLHRKTIFSGMIWGKKFNFFANKSSLGFSSSFIWFICFFNPLRNYYISLMQEVRCNLSKIKLTKRA